MPTLAALITQVREDRLNEPSEGFWQNQTLRRLINEAIRDIARKTEAFKDETSIAVTAGTQSYPLSLDFCVLNDPITFTPTGSSLRYPIEQVDYSHARTAWGINSALTRNLPTQCATQNYPGTTAMQILLFPIPSVNGSLSVYYAKFPTPLSSTGSDDQENVDVPTGWEDVILDYVQYRAEALRPGPEAAQRAAQARALYMENVTQLAHASINWSNHPGQIQMDPFDSIYGPWDW